MTTFLIIQFLAFMTGTVYCIATSEPIWGLVFLALSVLAGPGQTRPEHFKTINK